MNDGAILAPMGVPKLPAGSVVVALAAACMALPLAMAQDNNKQTRGAKIPAEDQHTSITTYGNRHALVMGIDEYDDPGYPDLGHAVADARAVAKTLVDRFGFGQDNVRLIVNQDASKDEIEIALEEWASDPERVAEDDFLVVFFAGHGVTREGGAKGSAGYLVPADGRQRRGQPSWGSLLGMDALEGISEFIPAKHALFILDCCFGGLAVKRAAPPIAAGLSSRARQVITAGSAEQPVLDAGGGGHSVFTAAVLDALEGSADLDGDQVVTFGELYNHVGRTVEQKTEKRQTPLQATFPDHEGGSIAFFAPGLKPGAMTAQERLKAMERSMEEQFAELEGFSDAVLVRKLDEEQARLWPRTPERIPDFRSWLERARNLQSRFPQHRESLLRVRQEAYLSQVVAGVVEEGDGVEPLWDQADPRLQWRFETLRELIPGLGRLQERITEVEQRKELAATIWQRSIGDFEDEWDEAINEIALGDRYDGLELEPQIGLVPLGPDPQSGLWEFWHVESGERPERDGATGKLVITGDTGMVLVLLPGGTFSMGAQSTDLGGPNYDPGAQGNEGPVHEVTLAAFLLSKYEMTQGQWQRIMGENPSFYVTDTGNTPVGAANPVEQVSWHQCSEALARYGLILPTEPQWEYGARAGTGTPWWCGATKDSIGEKAAGNLADAYARNNGAPESWGLFESWSDGATTHARVGSYAPNAFGLHDVQGNVWEWCRDGFGGYASGVGNGDGLRAVEVQGGTRNRVNRGGSFLNTASNARSANRNRNTPENRDNDLGARAARVTTGRQ